MLEDGSVFEGTACGDFKETVFNTVFNTAMTGYFQIITDKANLSDGVVFTYPLIGNQGVDLIKEKSLTPAVKAIIVRELCDFPTNPDKQMPLETYLTENEIPIIKDIDTRAIVRKLRDSGTMRGILTDKIDENTLDKIKAYTSINLVEKASTKEIVKFDKDNNSLDIGIIDLGSSKAIVDTFISANCKITLYPFNTKADEILNSHHDGIIISDGPGDPNDCKEIFEDIKTLAKSNIPMIAISLGHLVTALSFGAQVEKMKLGHRGANFPVKNINNSRTYISSQNHGYIISEKNLPETLQVSYINANDKTIEGIVYSGLNLKTYQFLPEASDTKFIIDEFLALVGGQND